MLTGSNSRPGSILSFVYFERDDMTGPNDMLSNCSSVTPGGECTRASVHTLSVGSWYIIRRGLSVGFEYSRYSVNKIGSSGAGDIKGVNQGDSVDLDSFEVGIRVEW